MNILKIAVYKTANEAPKGIVIAHEATMLFTVSPCILFRPLAKPTCKDRTISNQTDNRNCRLNKTFHPLQPVVGR